MPPIKFQLNQTSDLGGMSFEEFQDGRLAAGGHIWYRKGKILAILSLHVATMPLAKFQLHPTYGSGGDVKNGKS